MLRKLEFQIETILGGGVFFYNMVSRLHGKTRLVALIRQSVLIVLIYHFAHIASTRLDYLLKTSIFYSQTEQLIHMCMGIVILGLDKSPTPVIRLPHSNLPDSPNSFLSRSTHKTMLAGRPAGEVLAIFKCYLLYLSR